MRVKWILGSLQRPNANPSVLSETIWGLWCQKQVSQAGISNCIPQQLWDAITYPCLRYLLLVPKSSCNLLTHTGQGCFTAIGTIIRLYQYQVTLKDMGKTGLNKAWQTITKRELCAWYLRCSKSVRLIQSDQCWSINSMRPSDTYIYVGKLTIIGSDKGLSPDRRQAIIWTNAGILLIGPLCGNKLQWNFNRNSYIFIPENTFQNVVWKMAAILSGPQCVNPMHFL